MFSLIDGTDSAMAQELCDATAAELLPNQRIVSASESGTPGGTDELLLALRTLDLDRGGEVQEPKLLSTPGT